MRHDDIDSVTKWGRSVETSDFASHNFHSKWHQGIGLKNCEYSILRQAGSTGNNNGSPRQNRNDMGSGRTNDFSSKVL